MRDSSETRTEFSKNRRSPTKQNKEFQSPYRAKSGLNALVLNQNSSPVLATLFYFGPIMKTFSNFDFWSLTCYRSEPTYDGHYIDIQMDT